MRRIYVIAEDRPEGEIGLRLADTRRDLWRAIADLRGLMQFDVGEEDCPSG